MIPGTRPVTNQRGQPEDHPGLSPLIGGLVPLTGSESDHRSQGIDGCLAPDLGAEQLSEPGKRTGSNPGTAPRPIRPGIQDDGRDARVTGNLTGRFSAECQWPWPWHSRFWAECALSRIRTSRGNCPPR